MSLEFRIMDKLDNPLHMGNYSVLGENKYLYYETDFGDLHSTIETVADPIVCFSFLFFPFHH